MNCQDFEKLVIALARNQLLAVAVRKQGLTHAEVCIYCASLLAEEQTLLAGVRVLVAELAKQDAPARVEPVLLAAFRQQVTAVASPTSVPALWPMPVKTWPRSNWKLAAIAAGILVLISVLAIFWQRSSWPDKQYDARINTPTQSVTPEPQPGEPVVDHVPDLAQQPEAPRPRRFWRHRASGNDSDEIEVVTEFFPLREGEDLTVLESARLVRVELPGSALGEVGLPVNRETVNEPIKADVLLGDDGLARAIRFVR